MLLLRIALTTMLVGVSSTSSATNADTEASALHQTGVKLIQDFVCGGSEACLERRGEDLAEAAHIVIDACLADPEIPRYICLGFVANISNEGGGLEHPTCGGLEQPCVQRCDQIWSNGARHDCFMQCAIDQGIRRNWRKGSRWHRIWKCNDKGTSRGPFQMKKKRIKRCKKIVGPDFDPFNLRQAAECTMQIVKRTARAKRWPCGRVENRWLVAMKRVGAGVIRTVAEARVGRLIPNPKGAPVWVDGTPKVTEQICEESSYGRRGLRYYRECGKPCRISQATDRKVTDLASTP